MIFARGIGRAVSFYPVTVPVYSIYAAPGGGCYSTYAGQVCIVFSPPPSSPFIFVLPIHPPLIYDNVSIRMERTEKTDSMSHSRVLLVHRRCLASSLSYMIPHRLLLLLRHHHLHLCHRLVVPPPWLLLMLPQWMCIHVDPALRHLSATKMTLRFPINTASNVVDSPPCRLFQEARQRPPPQLFHLELASRV